MKEELSFEQLAGSIKSISDKASNAAKGAVKQIVLYPISSNKFDSVELI